MTAVGVHSIDHMIEFGGPVRDVLVTTGRYIAGPSDDTTNIMLRFKKRRDGPAVLLGRDRDDLELHVFGTKGLARDSPGPTWRAFASCRSRRSRRPDR